MPAVARTAEVQARGYVFAGPEVRRLTAEQFADAIGAITGEWSVYQPTRSPPAAADAAARRCPIPRPSACYGREWRAASSNLTRALGRPIRDQVISSRAGAATTPQALELVNGEMLTQLAVARGAADARRAAAGAAEPLQQGGGRTQRQRQHVRHRRLEATELWLIAQDYGSNAPERVEPVWAGAELVGADGRPRRSRR